MSEEITQRYPVDIENLKHSIVDTLIGFAIIYGLLLTVVFVQQKITKLLNKEVQRRSNERREQLQLKFESTIGIIFDLILLTFHILSCTLYIYESYNIPPYSLGVKILEVLSNVCFTLEFIKLILLDDSWLRESLSLHSIVNMFCILNVFGPIVGGDYVAYLGFLRFVRAFLTFQKTIRKFEISEVVQQLFLIGFTVLTLVASISGLLLLVENLGDPPNWENKQDLEYFTCFYWGVVTVSTVGYGDFLPKTYMGRSSIILMIGLALIIIPEQSSKLIDLLKNRPKHGGTYNEGGGHNVIISSDASAVESFLEEFYHPDHGNNSQTVILSIKHSPETYKLTRRREYSTRVRYYEGSASSSSDLKRVQLQKASNCFVLPPSVVTDVEQTEKELMLILLAIENFKKKIQSKGGKVFKTFAQLSRPDTAMQAEAAGVDVIVTAEVFKMSLLARSCLIPGFSTLIFNLLTSVNYDENQEDSWYKTYNYSTSQEIYKINLTQYGTTPFYEVVRSLYNNYKVSLFAIETSSCATLLNPGSEYVVSSNDIGFVIAPDSDTIEHIVQGRPANPGKSQIVPMSSMSSQIFSMKRSMKKSNSIKRDGNKVLSQLVQETYKSDADALLYDTLRFYNETQTQKCYKLVEVDQRESSEIAEEKIEIVDGFFTLMESASIDNVTVKGDVNFEDHIVICGGLATIKYFLKELRKESVKTQCPVVIIGNHPPSDEVWNEINKFPSVYYLKGSPIEIPTLDRARVENARAVCILADPNDKASDSDSIDANSIFIANTIESFYGNKPQIIVEFVNQSNVQFLTQRSETIPTKKNRFGKTKQVAKSSIIYYASGRAFVNSALSRYLVHLFYLGGNDSVVRNIVEGEVDLINIPSDFEGDYGQLFEDLLKKSLIAIGLYIHEGHGSVFPFVAASPKGNYKIHREDKVYVIKSSPQLFVQ